MSKKDGFSIEVNFLGIFAFYLIALLASVLNFTVGIVAFVCVTIVILAILWIVVREGKGEKKQ